MIRCPRIPNIAVESSFSSWMASFPAAVDLIVTFTSPGSKGMTGFCWTTPDPYTHTHIHFKGSGQATQNLQRIASPSLCRKKNTATPSQDVVRFKFSMVRSTTQNGGCGDHDKWPSGNPSLDIKRSLLRSISTLAGPAWVILSSSPPTAEKSERWAFRPVAF